MGRTVSSALPGVIVTDVIEIVGVPASGVTALGPAERALLLDAEVIVSSPRLLGGLDDLEPAPTAQRQEWPRPLLPHLDEIFTGMAGRRVVVLASGDPMVSGIGATLVRKLGPTGLRIHPAVSSVALAGARMGWDAGELAWVSLVGRPIESVTRHLVPGGRVLCLSADETTPGTLAAMLVTRGLGATSMTVLGDLGAASESRFDCVAANFAGTMPRLNIVALELPRVAEPTVGDGADHVALLGSTPGLPDDSFHSDGQFTKREIRATALAVLRPTPGGLLWDLGAGSGSVAAEWCLHHPTCRAVAVERNPARAARIRHNAADLGVSIDVVEGDIGKQLAILAQDETPDAIFLGGGATKQILEQAYAALPDGGRLVVHAVTLETESLLVDAYRRHTAHGATGELRRISVESAQPLGHYLSWTPARPVVQLTLLKESLT